MLIRFFCFIDLVALSHACEQLCSPFIYVCTEERLSTTAVIVVSTSFLGDALLLFDFECQYLGALPSKNLKKNKIVITLSH